MSAGVVFCFEFRKCVCVCTGTFLVGGSVEHCTLQTTHNRSHSAQAHAHTKTDKERSERALMFGRAPKQTTNKQTSFHLMALKLTLTTLLYLSIHSCIHLVPPEKFDRIFSRADGSSFDYVINFASETKFSQLAEVRRSTLHYWQYENAPSSIWLFPR